MARARKSRQPAERQALLEEALDGYRGGFLEDHQDVAWCTLEREKWRSLMLEGVEELLVLLGRTDDWSGMQRIADRLLSLEPAADLGHRARIAALAMQDRPHEAMRACEVAVESMARLGGLEPDFVTGDLIEHVREGSLSVRQVREAFESRWNG
jgi:DNA-binding SARP family transcriptional activator